MVRTYHKCVSISQNGQNLNVSLTGNSVSLIGKNVPLTCRNVSHMGKNVLLTGKSDVSLDIGKNISLIGKNVPLVCEKYCTYH